MILRSVNQGGIKTKRQTQNQALEKKQEQKKKKKKKHSGEGG
jgi:hypothetical protein